MIHMQRRDGNITLHNRFQVRAIGRIGNNALKIIPKIGAPARVHARINAQNRAVALALRGHTNFRFIMRLDMREIDIDQRARFPIGVQSICE